MCNIASGCTILCVLKSHLKTERSIPVHNVKRGLNVQNCSTSLSGSKLFVDVQFMLTLSCD
jgi:hypothetical protein